MPFPFFLEELKTFFIDFSSYIFVYSIKSLLLQSLLLPKALHGEKQGWETYT